LLSQIEAGTALKKLPSSVRAKDSNTETKKRGGLLYEIRSRGKAPPVAESPTRETSNDGDGAASARSATSSIVREGWMQKRAGNGLWQKRYFVLTRVALAYYNKPPTEAQKQSPIRDEPPVTPRASAVRHARPCPQTPSPRALSSPQHPNRNSSRHSQRAGTALDADKGGGEKKEEKEDKSVLHIAELHDAHPTGAAGEIAISAKDRVLRLRAKDAPDAAAWVAAIMSIQLEQGQDFAGPQKGQGTDGGSDGEAPLIAPKLTLSVFDDAHNRLATSDGAAAAFVELAARLHEPTEHSKVTQCVTQCVTRVY
jgi:hypothetical protein